MFIVKITGFKTRKAAEEFMNWYENQGEQDISIWWDECNDPNIGNSPYVDVAEMDSQPTSHIVEFAIKN